MPHPPLTRNLHHVELWLRARETGHEAKDGVGLAVGKLYGVASEVPSFVVLKAVPLVGVHTTLCFSAYTASRGFGKARQTEKRPEWQMVHLSVLLLGTDRSPGLAPYPLEVAGVLFGLPDVLLDGVLEVSAFSRCSSRNLCSASQSSPRSRRKSSCASQTAITNAYSFVRVATSSSVYRTRIDLMQAPVSFWQ